MEPVGEVGCVVTMNAMTRVMKRTKATKGMTARTRGGVRAEGVADEVVGDEEQRAACSTTNTI